MRTPIAPVVLAALVALSGCLSNPAAPSEEDTAPVRAFPNVLPAVVTPVIDDTMTFSEHVVTAAVSYFNDLYEPTMEVSDSGVIYVTGHTILVDTTGAPVFMSKDEGATWAQLPFLGPATMPGDLHSATPPPSDEIFVLGGDDGWLYGVDITAVTFPVNAWSGDGAEHAYHNPNAFNRADSTKSVCGAAGLNDRPWGAYANGKLLMVNNPGLGRVEIGAMDVPPATPVGIGAPVVGATWNTCATSGGSIPGIPGMRHDHFFAVPQVQDGRLIIVTGNAADVMTVEVIEVFENTNTGPGTLNSGHVTFDQEGTMFIGIRNNTEEDSNGDVTGRLHLAVSQDDGQTFVDRTLVVGTATSSIYLDGNMAGPGALLSWAQEGAEGTDWYVAHVFVGLDGGPVVENVNRVIENGPGPSAHVQGAAAGPDGRSYIVTFHGDTNPLHVWVQQDGPVLPVVGALAALVE